MLIDYITIEGSHKQKDWHVARITGQRGSATISEIVELGHFTTAKAAAKVAYQYAIQHGIATDDYVKFHSRRA